MNVIYGLGDDSLMLPPPPITTSVVSGGATNIAELAQISNESTAAQVAAFNQGFISTDSVGAWLAQNWPYLAGGLLIVMLFLPSGHARRYGP